MVGFGRLKGRSFRELRFRAGQASRAVAERAGVQLGARDARTLSESILALPFPQARALTSYIANRWPAHAAERVRSAELLLTGHMPLLGFDVTVRDGPDRWHADPLTGQVAPHTHWSRVPYLNASIVGDHKRVWELNRHQHFLVLAQAYVLTGDARFTDRIVREMLEWIDANPPAIGINWASALELGVRSIAWLWALHLIDGCAAMTPSIRRTVTESLARQLLHVEANLSYYFSPNTHLTGEALALLYGGTAFGAHPIAQRWRAKGRKILEREFMRQLRADGTYFEQSSWYQRYTADFGMHFLALVGADTVGEPLRQRLTAATDVLRWTSRPDGTLPMFGDDDGGTLLPLDDRASARSVHGVMALAAVLNRDAAARDYVTSCPPSLAWILGRDGVEAFDHMHGQPTTERQCAYVSGGLYIARSNWSTDANMLIMDGGPHGDGAHGHADALSLEVVQHGVPLFVDPGTLTYVDQLRDTLRGTSAHSTVTVGNKPSSEPRGPFGWSRKANTRVTQWERIDDDRGIAWSAEHDGYTLAPLGITVRRSVLWLDAGILIVSDLLVGAHEVDAVPVQVAWQLDAGWACSVVGEHSVTCGREDESVQMTMAGVAARWRVQPTIVSAAYGASVPAVRVSAESIMSGRQWHILTVIHPAALTGSVHSASSDATTASISVTTLTETVDISLAPADSRGAGTSVPAPYWEVHRRTRVATEALVHAL